MSIELIYFGPDGVRCNDGQFNTDHRYLRKVPSSPLSRMVAGPSMKLAGGTVFSNTNVPVWSFSVGPVQDDTYGIGYPTNSVRDFAL